jgi:hypothetical protein
MTNDTPDPCEPLTLKIATSAAQIVELHNQAVREYGPVVGRMIRSSSQDVRQIEAMLDRLLDVACAPEGLTLFKALCRYYYLIDPASAAYYMQCYRELWDDDPESKK